MSEIMIYKRIKQLYYVSNDHKRKVIAMQKRLYRIREGKKLCGVCGGIAEYFDLDPTVVRLATALLCIFAGAGIPAYIIAALIVPEKPLGIDP